MDEEIKWTAIKIDLELWKYLNEKRLPSERFTDVLRKLLNLPPLPDKKEE